MKDTSQKAPYLSNSHSTERQREGTTAHSVPSQDPSATLQAFLEALWLQETWSWRAWLRTWPLEKSLHESSALSGEGVQGSPQLSSPQPHRRTIILILDLWTLRPGMGTLHPKWHSQQNLVYWPLQPPTLNPVHTSAPLQAGNLFKFTEQLRIHLWPIQSRRS